MKNYVPVTDAMLKNPDPGDWLMVRRNYQAWSDSPLSQITTDNVRGLRLAWVWTMNDGPGRNQPTPLVHNGIMYLVHPGHIVQALDARTGDLIWENNVGPNSTTALRNLAIYENNVFMATNDARLVALDARNGKIVWEAAHRRQRQRLSELERPDRHQRQGDSGTRRLRRVQRGRLLHQRL